LQDNGSKIKRFAEGILKNDRIALARAITLVESTLPDDRKVADDLIASVLHATGKSLRIGISGSPGVGKSTFIEALGKYLVDQNIKVAVLSVDPTSHISDGSILGDKTRMEELSKNKNAFIRPSASGKKLGGVALRTREAMLLCEAAGYEVILVETVGVGQSEFDVKGMTDYLLLLLLARAGDELQAIKKGIMEMADGIVITKADGDNVAQARMAMAEIRQALHSRQEENGGVPRVLLTSALQNEGIAETWKMITDETDQMKKTGAFEKTRAAQESLWLKEYFDFLLHSDAATHGPSQYNLGEIRSVPEKAKELLAEFYKKMAGRSR
jgi:LAO/AO transport system kinase